MNSVLVEALDAFKMSARNIIRDRFSETNLLPLSPPNLTTNTQAYAASIQVSSGAKDEEINSISHQTVAPIEVQVTRTDDPMVFFQAKGTQKSLRNNILQDAEYDILRKIAVTPIQHMRKECMTIIKSEWYHSTLPLECIFNSPRYLPSHQIFTEVF